MTKYGAGLVVALAVIAVIFFNDQYGGQIKTGGDDQQTKKRNHAQERTKQRGQKHQSRSQRQSRNVRSGSFSGNRDRQPATRDTPAQNTHNRVTGTPHVIDGDSLEIGSTRIRLFGIDAPEGRQFCNTETGERWPCGRQASLALRQKIANRPVTCIRRDTDPYGRMVSRCTLDGLDLNSWMVKMGHAMAFRKFGTDYVADEQHAKSQKIGLWRGDFTPPWQWRRQHPK